MSSSVLPVALTSTDDNGRLRGETGKCGTCQLSAGERTEDWSHACPEIDLFHVSKVEWNLNYSAWFYYL